MHQAYNVPKPTVVPDSSSSSQDSRPFWGVPDLEALGLCRCRHVSRLLPRGWSLEALDGAASSPSPSASRLHALGKAVHPHCSDGPQGLFRHKLTPDDPGHPVSHSPMSLVSLMCRLHLSNDAFLVTTALQCAVCLLSVLQHIWPSTRLRMDTGIGLRMVCYER